mgnify:FL=1
MSYSLVTDQEFCWVLQWVEPARTSTLAQHLPTSDKGAYMRLRRFDGAYVTHDVIDTKTYEWMLTDAGHELVDESELPAIEDVDLEEYFAGRSTSINPNAILYEIAIHEDEWVPTSPLYDALPYSRSTLRKRLNRFHDTGELDRDGSAKTNHWRLTDAGYDRLEDADEIEPRDSSTRIFERRPT